MTNLFCFTGLLLTEEVSVVPAAGHVHCWPCGVSLCSFHQERCFLFIAYFSQSQQSDPDGNHLFGSVWTKPNPLGKFPSVIRPGKNLEVQRNFLHCNFLITFSSSQGLHLAWALENIQARAHYVQIVFLPFTSTWKQNHKKPITAPKQKKNSKFQFYRWSSAVLSPRSVASL